MSKFTLGQKVRIKAHLRYYFRALGLMERTEKAETGIVVQVEKYEVPLVFRPEMPEQVYLVAVDLETLRRVLPEDIEAIEEPACKEIVDEIDGRTWRKCAMCKRHIGFHRCRYCGKKYKTPWNLKWHEERCHFNPATHGTFDYDNDEYACERWCDSEIMDFRNMVCPREPDRENERVDCYECPDCQAEFGYQTVNYCHGDERVSLEEPRIVVTCKAVEEDEHESSN
jgi:hypothetical protein